MMYRTLLPVLVLAPQLLWAAQPLPTMSGRCIRIAMADASVARVGLNQPAKSPWYRLSDLTDFVLDFSAADSFTAVTDYCPDLDTEVSVTYDAGQGKVKLQSEDFSADIVLRFIDKNTGSAEIVWHEAGNTRYFRGAAFTVQNEADDIAHLELPMEQIARDPEILDDGLQEILWDIEKMVPRNATEKLYKTRLTTLLPLVMMSQDASYTNPDYKGNTALHYACGLSHVELVRWLVEHGADLEARTEKGASIDACVGGRNAAAIKTILSEARAWRDKPYHGPEIDEEEARDAAGWLDVAFSGYEMESPDYIIPAKDEKAEACGRLAYRYVKAGGSPFSLGLCMTETPSILLSRVMRGKVSEEMFMEWLLRELEQRRMYQQVVRRKDGLSLAALPHMILHREEEGMPYDGKSPLYRAAEEGNAELVRWLLKHSPNRRITNERGEPCELPADAPNAAAIKETINRASAVGCAPASVVGKTLTFTAPSLAESYSVKWKKANVEKEGAVAVDEDWSIIELRYTRTGNATATVIRRAQWSPGGHYASGWSEKVFTLQFNTPDSGTATCSDTSKTGTPMMYHGTFTLK